MGFLLLQFSFLSELNLVWRAGGRGPARKSDKFDRVIDRDAKVKRSGIVFVWAWPHTRKRLSHDCKRRPRQQQQQRCNIIATYTMPRGLWVSRCIKQKQNDSNLRFFLSFGNLHFEMMIEMIATVQFEFRWECAGRLTPWSSIADRCRSLARPSKQRKPLKMSWIGLLFDHSTDSGTMILPIAIAGFFSNFESIPFFARKWLKRIKCDVCVLPRQIGHLNEI